MATIIDNIGFSFSGIAGYVGLYFDSVATDGSVTGNLFLDDGSSIDIAGMYDSTTRNITFNNASFPGEILFTTFFSGQVFTTPDGSAALSIPGNWTEQELTFTRPSSIKGRRIAKVVSKSGMFVAYNPIRNPL